MPLSNTAQTGSRVSGGEASEAAWLRFLRRDIRLSGEGSWRLPFLLKHRKTS
jgi:hypothetical protein